MLWKVAPEMPVVPEELVTGTAARATHREGSAEVTQESVSQVWS